MAAHHKYRKADAPQSRGFTIPFAFGYDSNAAFHRIPGWPGTWADNSGTYLAEGGWSYVVPSITGHVNMIPYNNPSGPEYQCHDFVGMIFTDMNGGTHAPPVSPTEKGNTNNCVYVDQPPQWHPGSLYQSGADAKIQAATTWMQQGVVQPITVADADGLVYYFGALNRSGITPSAAALPTSIEDRNGNQATFQDSGGGTFTITDTSGRTALSSSGFGATGNTVTASGQTGSYTLTWGAQQASNMLTHSYETALLSPWPSGFGPCPSGPASQIQWNHITRITLPNGKFYSFLYDSGSSLIKRITYPNGAYIRYVWGINTNYEFGLLTAPKDSTGSADCEEQYDTYALQNRFVSFDGVNEVLEQDFSYPPPSWVVCPNSAAICEGPQNGLQQAWTQKQTTVTTKVSTVSNGTLQSLGQFKTVYTYIPGAIPATPNSGVWFGGSATPLESEVDYYDFDGTLKRSVKKTWVDPQLPPNETVILDNGLQSQTTYAFQQNGTYSGTWGTNPTPCNITCLALETDEYQYDYGTGAPGALLKHTHVDYQSFLTTPSYSADLSIFDRSKDVITYDGNGNRVAEMDYLFDGASVGQVSPAAKNHDEGNYGIAYNNRGNATTKTAQCIGCTNAVTTYTYDETGQVLSRKDPCGNATCSDMTGSNHTTTYSYADSYTVLSGGSNTGYTPPTNTNSYLTSITDPLGHTPSFKYDYNNGQLTSLTDPNGQVTSYIYADDFARPTQASFPDGGLTTVSYDDVTPAITTTKSIGSGLNLVSEVVMDGAGHPTQTQLTDTQGTIYAVTTYDGLGNVKTVSNPYRSTSDPTYGITTHVYDALSRKTVEYPPDYSSSYPNNKTQYAYSGNTVTVTDEASHTRETATNALGQLTQVIENSAQQFPLSFETDYFYDALGNMYCLVQKGNAVGGVSCSTTPGATNPFNNLATNGYHGRWFVYNSLSRLTDAYNPESGHMNWTYDNNGNVSTRTDARSVTTTYGYDVTNRTKQKSYSDSITPAVAYYYDGNLPTGPTITPLNPIGRRTGMLDGSGWAAWSYDPMGRTSVEQEKIGTAASMKTSYVYNYLGAPTSITYPNNTVMSYTYDNVGRVATVIDTTHGINYVLGSGTLNSPCTSAPSPGVSYAAQGAPALYLLGCDPNRSNYGLNVTAAFDNRLQPSMLTANSLNPSNGTAMSYSYLWNNGVSDNGNLAGIVNNAITHNSPDRSKNFYYDAYNRIVEYKSPNSNLWDVKYTIDAWGNLIGKTAQTQNGYGGESFQTSANNANQITGVTYDNGANPTTAGDVTFDGQNNYAYDGENRIYQVTNLGISYVYDGDGNRVQKSTGTSYWGGSAGNALLETDNSGNPTSEYVYFNGQRVARRFLPSGLIRYYLTDQVGSSTVLTDIGGGVDDIYDYAPYGELHWQWTVDQNYPNHYFYTGKERDSESGLDNFGARYHASTMGRFMTPDSASYSNRKNPQSWNLYAYALNNPVSFRDADGHKIDCANNTEQCQKDAAAATGNAEAAKRVTTETKTHGWWIFKSTETSIKITGDINSFRALSPNASKLADLVTSKDTVTVSYDQYAKPSFWANGIKLNGGSTSYSPSQGYDAQAFIDPSRTAGAVYDQDAVNQHIPQANTGEEFGHEVLGHIWGEMFGGAPAGTRANMRDSIIGEDAVRALDPTRGQKGLESHHNYNEMPPDPPPNK